MSGPLVSIIVSCYNSEVFVRETLNSLVNQTYQNIEIIIVNDGSTDKSEEVILSFNQDERIRYYVQENKGQCAALNFGFTKSTGEYIKFYDSDDILSNDSIAEQLNSLKQSAQEDISFIEWRRFYNNVLPTFIDHNHFHTIHRDCTPFEYLTFTGKMPMVQCGLWLIPRSLLLKGGLWDERLSLINDTEFFSRLLPHANRLIFSKKGYTFYRSNPNDTSLSKDVSKKGIKSALLSIDLMAKWLLNLEESDKIKKIIVSSYQMILIWSYPSQITISKIIERRINSYPSKCRQIPPTSLKYKITNSLIGWKLTTRLAKLLAKYYYNKRLPV